MKVSFDFDGTLEFQHVQDYAKELIEKGIEVWIVTTRWDRTSRFCDPTYFKFHGNRSWEEVHEVAKNLGIPIKRCVFTNYKWKATYFENNRDFVWHLDDNYEEHKGIQKCGVASIDVVSGNWMSKCNRLLGLI